MNRRKFINISASSLAFSLVPNSLFASKSKVSWEGQSLGANSSLQLFHEDPAYAKQTINEVLKKIYKLEMIFSLYQKNSSINQLNKQGFLNKPPKKLIELLQYAQKISKDTNGYFDISVQPLWENYSKNYNNEKKLEKKLKEIKKLVNYKNIHISKEKIYFEKKNMKITLNGIAQGFITDEITAFLKQKGFTNVLINLGEINTIGTHPNKRAWNIQTPYLKQDYISIKDEALASSGAYGTRFNKKYHHLFNAVKKQNANYIEAVSIKAKNATLADALSTAFFVMPKKQRNNLEKLYSKQIEVFYM